MALLEACRDGEEVKLKYSDTVPFTLIDTAKTVLLGASTEALREAVGGADKEPEDEDVEIPLVVPNEEKLL